MSPVTRSLIITGVIGATIQRVRCARNAQYLGKRGSSNE
jgi:hypothetical protein